MPDVIVIAGITPVESGTAGTFKIGLDSPAPVGGLTINYILSGTANSNTDYTVTAGTNITAVSAGSFTVAAGQTTAKLTINAGNDGVADPNETVTLSATTGIGYQFTYDTVFTQKMDVYTDEPSSVSVGDFNGDGKTDLVVASSWYRSSYGFRDTVTVMLRNAANTGFDTVDVSTGSNPNPMCVGDFNGDGKADLVGFYYYSDTVSVLLRNAANTGFDPKVDLVAGLHPVSVSAGDFNGDGKLDLAVTNSGSNTVSVFLRDGANTGFDPKVDVAIDSAPTSLSVGDFNGDGKADFAFANFSSNKVSVLLRNADNTGFDPKVDYDTGTYPKSVSVGDFNGDGKADLAVAYEYSNTVSVLLRNAANTGFDPKVDFVTGSYSYSVSVGDFNGDGKADLAIVHGSGSDTVSVLLRNVDNTGFDPKLDFATGTYPLSVSVGDFNGDGKTDLATANLLSNSVSVLLNNTIFHATLTITDHNPANIAPTLTAFSSTVASGNEDSKITITFADLQAQGNEADVDGTVTAFVIKAVSTGTLLIGTSAGTATAWNAVTNNTVDAANQAYWTPVLNTNGIFDAFTAVAKDNGGFESASPIQTIISVAPVNDLPTLTTFASTVASGNEDSQIGISFADLQAQGNEADVDGTVTNFVIKAVSAGTLLIGTSTVTATAWNESTNNIIDLTHNAYWTPVANANGILGAFTVVAQDNYGLESASAVQATVSVASVNDLPTLTAFSSTVASGNEDSQITITFANIQAQGNEADVDGTVTAFVIKAVSTGTLLIGTSAGTATAWNAVTNNTVDAANQAYWTPVLNTNGIFDAFTAVAKDNGGLESISVIQATVAVTAVNDAPTGAVTIDGTATQYQLLTASNSLADVDGLDSITYQWHANGTAISGATASTLTLAQAQVGKTITVKATYTDLQGTAESVSSSETLAVVNVNDAPTGAVTITGTATQGQILTASNTLADVDGLGPISYQWLANGVAIAGATATTLTLAQAQVNKVITVNASYTDLLGSAENVSSLATTAVANVNDAPTGIVTITGTSTQGQILTASNTLADLDGLGPISYQWLANGEIIVGENASTISLSQAQVDKAIMVQASFIDQFGATERVFSLETVNVANINDLPVGVVTITGTATQGQILTASNTLADVDGLGSISYQWLANGVAIDGANASTITLAQAQVDQTITVNANYTDLFGSAENVTSSATTAIENVNDAPTGTFTITGTPTQGQILTASNALADVDGLGAISYQWLMNGVAITGATATTLTLAQAQVGKAITVKASYIDLQGTSESVTSALTRNVININDVSTGIVYINGTPTQGQILTASNTLADVDGLGSISYQWLANGLVIDGENASTTTLAQAQVGKAITVKASYIDLQGTSESVTSALSRNVININDVPTGAVYINGTPTQGQILTVSNTLADVDGLGSISYQWLANGVAIAGATASTLTLAQVQVDKTISVKASYNDQQGTREEVTSVPTKQVEPSDTIGPIVTNFNPTDGAAAVAVGSNIILTFNEAIQKSSGMIAVIAGSPYGNLFESFDATSSTRLTISGNTLTIDPTVDLANNTHYNVVITTGAIKDLTGNSYIGTFDYDFTTTVATNIINGTAGNNSLVGTNASDSINGGKGADTMKGDLGSDTYYVDNKGDKVIESKNAGTDTVYSSISFILGANLENLTLNGKTVINGTGNALNNSLLGNAAANKLSGLAGNDILNGGLGKDILTGGTGKDVFDFNSVLEIGKKTKGDFITDFSHKQDKINLFDIDANTSNRVGNDAFKYIGEKAFTGKAGELHFVKGVLSGDTNGDKVTDFDLSITLVGATNLVSQDFVL